MNAKISYAVRRAILKRFHPLVRYGLMAASGGKDKPRSQTALGLGMMAAGLLLQSSHKKKTKPLYVYTTEPGKTTCVRVYKGRTIVDEVKVQA